MHKHFLQFLLGVKMAPRETENNAYAKFWGDKQRAIWNVMYFLGWSIVSDRGGGCVWGHHIFARAQPCIIDSIKQYHT